MKTKPDDIAFPGKCGNGLTKREYIAAKALQGLLTIGHEEYMYMKSEVILAVEFADELIEALNESKG